MGSPSRECSSTAIPTLGVVILVIREIGVNLKYYRRDFTPAFSASRLFFFSFSSEVRFQFGLR